jgi:S-adenosylmethionine decarboxylase
MSIKNDIKIRRENEPIEDFFMEKDGSRFAGIHLLVEFWGAEGLKDVDLIETALRDASQSAGATVLGVHAHIFSSGGVTGIAVLEESHISIHTWPERGFAAIDIFMCGKCHPHAAIEPLKNALKPCEVTVAEHKRGIPPLT